MMLDEAIDIIESATFETNEQWEAAQIIMVAALRMQELSVARKLATSGKWILYGEHENNLPTGIFADQESDGLKEVCVCSYAGADEEFIMAAANITQKYIEDQS